MSDSDGGWHGRREDRSAMTGDRVQGACEGQSSVGAKYSGDANARDGGRDLNGF